MEKLNLQVGDRVSWTDIERYPFFIFTEGYGVVVKVSGATSWILPEDHVMRSVIFTEWGQHMVQPHHTPDIIDFCIQYTNEQHLGDLKKA